MSDRGSPSLPAVDTAMNEITQILQDSENDPLDESRLYAAECDLKHLQEHDFPDFLLSLSAKLTSNESPPRDCIKLAGIVLMNSLDRRNYADDDLLLNQWTNLDQLIKMKIKESLLIALGSSVPEAWHASSQVIAKVAYIEIPRREWPDLIGKLLANMAHQGASPPLKQATLEALGCLFEEIVELDPDEVNAILNAVIKAMNQAEQSSEVRFAAVEALQNVLKQANLANDDCRNLIMSAICDTAESDEAKIKQKACGCLVVIASKYYAMFEPYMDTILSITTDVLKGGVESGALQCIEFWITICEKVIELRKQNKPSAHAILPADCEKVTELRERNKPSAHAILPADCCFIEKPLSSVVPVLLQTLLNQEGGDDEQSISMSGTKCLGLIARTIGDAIVPLAMQFVEGNIEASDWKSRKAATSALGVILDGPSIKKLAPVVRLLVGRMEDPNMEVRGTAVCTLGRVFELLHFPDRENRVFTYGNLPFIVTALGKRCFDVPEVSKEACVAIYFLAKGYDHSKKEISSELSPFLSNVIDCLVYASTLAKETPFKLPTSASAYKALREVVKVSNIQDSEASMAIRVLMPCIMRRLNTVLDAKASSAGEERNKYNLLVLLCGVLHVIIQKLGNTLEARQVTETAPFVLLLFCRVLTCKRFTARDKAALAIGALADATGPDFVDHMPILLQYFNVKLLCPTYLRVISNIFRVLGERILPYCDGIMDVLYKGFSKSMLKSPILECFGVIALAIGKNFEKYLQAVMEKLREAASPRYYGNVFDEGKVGYGNQLRQGILKAYSGILSGLMDSNLSSKVLADLSEFTEAVRKDKSRDASVVISAADDLLSKFGYGGVMDTGTDFGTKDKVL